MKVEVTEVLELPDDRLLVSGTIDGEPASALGWASALSNHYPESAYEDGALKLKPSPKSRDGVPMGDPAARPRKMKAAEKLDYCKALLTEQNPMLAKPKKLSIKG